MGKQCSRTRGCLSLPRNADATDAVQQRMALAIPAAI